MGIIMHALIYQPGKTAMQSGRAKTGRWCLKPAPRVAPFIDPLMGWNGQRDTLQQVSLWFDTKEEAIRYAKQENIPYTVQEPHARKMQPKSYADNFAYARVKRFVG